MLATMSFAVVRRVDQRWLSRGREDRGDQPFVKMIVLSGCTITQTSNPFTFVAAQVAFQLVQLSIVLVVGGSRFRRVASG